MDRIPIIEVVISLERGGRRNRLIDNLRAIDRSIYAPILCTLQSGPDDRAIEKELQVPVHTVFRREGFDLRVTGRLIDLIFRENVRLMHVHDGSSELYGCLAATVAQIPIVSTFHRSRNFEFSGKVRHWLCNRLLMARVAVSEARRKDLIEDARSDPARTFVIHGAVDLDRFGAQALLGRLAVRRELSLLPEQPVLLSIGHYGEEKGHDVTLRAMRQVIDRFPAVKLLISGSGSDRDRGALLRLRDTLGLGDHVDFLGWRDDPQRLLAACDIFVQPSRVEAFGLVFAEASAMGRPVVSTRVGGIPEIIKDGRTGLLVPPTDPPALSEAIEKLLHNPGLARQMGEAGMKVAREQFSLQRMVGAYHDLFEKVLTEWERDRARSWRYPLIQNGGQRLAAWMPASLLRRDVVPAQTAGSQGGQDS